MSDKMLYVVDSDNTQIPW